MELNCSNVTKKYVLKKAIDDFTYTFTGGRVYALLGPNGSGKSTLMKTIAGLTTPEKGTISFNGHNLTYRDKAHIAYMPTEGYFFPYMNCLDAGNYYKDFFNDFEVDEYMYLLDKMELDPKQKIRTMSSGMLAKMKIAITMARNADLIMLDEPFNGIDLIARDKVMETVIQSISEDMTVIISSHLVDELEKIVDTAVFMKDGRLVTTIDAESARMEENESLQDAYRRIYTEEENR